LASAVLMNNLVPLAQVAWRLRLHPFGRATLAAAALAVACFAVPPLLLRLATAAAVPAVTVTAAGITAYLTGVARLRKTFTEGKGG
jgi:hypothetical protein